MKLPIVAEWLRQRRTLSVGLGVIVASILLLTHGQVLSAVLVVVVGGLLLEIERRNVRARILAQRLAQGQVVDKIEVAYGAWGELCRAINSLTQEQRRHERRRLAGQVPLPDVYLQALLERPIGAQSTAAVLLIGVQQPRGNQRGTVGTWQALATAAQSLAQQHGALLQPCGDALLLAFGALHQCPIEVSLVNACTVAAALRNEAVGASLAISITGGNVYVNQLPGVGCWITGEPVEQAIQIKRLALAAPLYQTLCDESAYYALRRYSEAWRPTEFRIPGPHGQAQVVYGALANALTAPALAEAVYTIGHAH